MTLFSHSVLWFSLSDVYWYHPISHSSCSLNCSDVMCDLIVCQDTHVIHFPCYVGKYSTRPMNKMIACRLTPYSLDECCIFPYRNFKNVYLIVFPVFPTAKLSICDQLVQPAVEKVVLVQINTWTIIHTKNNPFSARTDNRRQILTSIVDPRAERVNI